MITFAQAIAEVGEWSKQNFGDQKGAGVLAPCLGIAEELGEFDRVDNYILDSFDDWDLECGPENFRTAEAAAFRTDALCDTLVYLADVCSRSGIILDVPWPDTAKDAVDQVGIVSLTDCYGKLAHVILKRHQGIRGFDNDAHFTSELQKAAVLLFISVCACFEYTQSPAEEFLKVWTSVSKRDWVSDPVGAGAEVLL